MIFWEVPFTSQVKRRKYIVFVEGMYQCGLICDSVPMTTFSVRLQNSCYYIFKNVDIGIILHISLENYSVKYLPTLLPPRTLSYHFLIIWRTCTKERMIIIVPSCFSVIIKCFVLLFKPQYVFTWPL